MFDKTSKTNILFDNFLQHMIMQESIASSPRPSKGGMQQIGVSDRNPYTAEWQNVVDHMQMGVEKTPMPPKICRTWIVFNSCTCMLESSGINAEHELYV
jgi:hypothetical protein